eukprot:798842-Lingulodinium_polyedra.AAC.1
MAEIWTQTQSTVCTRVHARRHGRRRSQMQKRTTPTREWRIWNVTGATESGSPKSKFNQSVNLWINTS